MTTILRSFFFNCLFDNNEWKIFIRDLTVSWVCPFLICRWRSHIRACFWDIHKVQSVGKFSSLSYLHTRQPTKPRPMPTNFYGLVGYDRVKITRSDCRAYLSPTNIRCILTVSLMQPRSNPALPDLHPSFRLTNPRSARPTPTYSWYNYDHKALIYFSIRKKGPILCLRIPVLKSMQVTADHHAVTPLNIRPVWKAGSFQTVEKLIPLTTTSQSGPH